MRAVQLIIKDHGLKKGVICLLIIEGLFVWARSKESIEFTFITSDNDPTFSIQMIFDIYCSFLSLIQFFAITDNSFLKVANILLDIFDDGALVLAF